MKIRIKIGTMPVQYIHVCRKRIEPKMGERIQVKSDNQAWVSSESVIIDDIKIINGEKLYFAYRM